VAIVYPKNSTAFGGNFKLIENTLNSLNNFFTTFRL